jgi:hypothetical protein
MPAPTPQRSSKAMRRSCLFSRGVPPSFSSQRITVPTEPSPTTAIGRCRRCSYTLHSKEGTGLRPIRAAACRTSGKRRQADVSAMGHDSPVTNNPRPVLLLDKWLGLFMHSSPFLMIVPRHLYCGENIYREILCQDNSSKDQEFCLFYAGISVAPPNDESSEISLNA